MLFAVTVIGLRRWRMAKEEARRAGGSLRTAISVHGFDQIDRIVGRRYCRCGERLLLRGEDSRQIESRRFRVVIMACPECEREERLYFDVTRIFH